MALTDEEKRKAKMYAYQDASFMFIPNALLREMIVKNHPKTEGINPSIKILILEGKAIRLDPEMIKKYCDNKLSESNTWLLDQGDIKVEPKKIQI